MGLVSELRRRNVFRMAVLYVVAAWLIMQVAEVLIALAKLPDWIGPTTLILLAVGFPIAVIVSWFYEITTEGISLEQDIEPGEPVRHVTGRRLDFLVISLLCAAIVLFAYDKWWIGTPPEQSIAVLPFENMSGDPEMVYFSDGFSDTLIHALAQVNGLKVTARTSSFHFKGQDIDARAIASQLGVANVLEGSVQRVGDKLRVVAQLIEAETGFHRWSKNYDRDLIDIFAIQDEIAQEVVRALKASLLDNEEKRLAQRYQPTLEAYEQLILGQYQMAKPTADSLADAEQHFKQAIVLDPDYALAYVRLANTYNLQESYGGLLLEESSQRRQPLVEKALVLDPLSGEAHMAMAYLRNAQQMTTPAEDFIGIEEEILKALELIPNSAQAHHWYSERLSYDGRFEEALAQIRLAAELDPMSPTIQTTLARSIWNAGRAEEALTMIRRNVERTPEFPDNYISMADFQTKLGHLGEAQLWLQEAGRENPDAYNWWLKCIGFMSLGESLSAEACVKQLSETHPEKLVSRVAWAELYQHRGEWDKAISEVEYLSARLPGWPNFDRWLADLVAGQGNVERARWLMADAFPEFLEDEVDLELDIVFQMETNLLSAIVFAAILDANDETQQRDVLLLAVEKRIASMHRTRGVGYGILDVYIHAMRGDRDLAIAGLREAIDMGWRGGDEASRILRQNWKLANLHQNPEFIAMMNELEADIYKQRQWYEDHKDDPLF